MSSSSLPIKPQAQGQWAAAFALLGGVVQSGEYMRSASKLYDVTFLRFGVAPGEIDGNTVLAGDEKLYVRTSDLPTSMQPTAGDVIETDSGAIKHTVLCASLDVSEVVWKIFCRRSV